MGAAWRLKELKHDNFKVYEKLAYPGGLAASFVDKNGFTWDVGGHVQFSHYKYFDQVVDSLLNGECLYHERSSWVWIRDRFLPYPFQNNIRNLPKEDMLKCLFGLIDLYRNSAAKPRNFKEWIHAVFGKGIAEVFMMPYNYKVWAYPPEKLTYSWISERVAVADLKRIVENIVFEKDDISWGPNNKFKFPLRGGTGEVWRRLFERLDKGKVFFNAELIKLKTKDKIIEFKNGQREDYDILISTLPLDRLVMMSDLKDKSSAKKLIHSSTHTFGIGLKGKTPENLKTKCWMYFPENNNPFYRVTVFSNYSPNNVPDINQYWSLMAEVSESPDKPVNHSTVSEEVIQGLLNTRLINSRDAVVDFWHHYEPYGYPTPSLKRNEALNVLGQLDKVQVHSRGRFGAWKYEVSNQDHSFMQGVEVINSALLKEKEMTVWRPEVVNDKSYYEKSKCKL